MNKTTFKQFCDVPLFRENTSTTEYTSNYKEFDDILSTISAYMSMYYPHYLLVLKKMKVFRVLSEPEPNHPRRQRGDKRFQTIVDPTINTMCVDGYGNLFINQQFMFDEWRKDQVTIAGVIIHEIMHVINFHVQRFKNIKPVNGREKDMKIWNYATDYTINWHIKKMDELAVSNKKKNRVSLPDGALMADKTGDAQIPGLSQPINILDGNDYVRDPYEIYVMIMNQLSNQDPEQDENGQSGGDGGDPSDQGGDPIDKHVYDDELVKKIESQGAEPNKMSREDWQETERKVTHVENQMRREIARMGGTEAGGNLRTQVRAGQQDWRQLLEQFFRAAVSNRTRNNWGRPNKRSFATGTFRPKRVADTQYMLEDIPVVAIDTSGSTMDYHGMFLGEVQKICKDLNTKTRVILWDAEVGDDYTVDAHELKPNETISVTGGGGTVMSVVARYLTKRYEQHGEKPPSVVIYLTDGFLADSSPEVLHERTNNLVLVIPGGMTTSTRDLPNTTTVKMIDQT